MSKKHDHDPNNPVQDFVDMQEHRYDPGYWITEWEKKGRLDPFRQSMRKANLSCFNRTILIFAIVGSMVTGIFSQFAGDLSHPKLWCLTILILLFLGIWRYIHKSMVRYGSVTDEKAECSSRKQP
jgi:hypothetical protein